jgi:XTP/dITP diphosphohydrolase
VGRRVLLASRNAKKLDELRRLLVDTEIDGLEIVGLDGVPDYPETVEDGQTFADNALAKARDGASSTGLPTLADDSGLSVDALNGMPGVLSARWSGRHGDDAANTALLLGQLADVPDARRGARFVSVCALIVPAAGHPAETVVAGEWRGRIARAASGAGGFGYDPVFIPTGMTCTAASLTPDQKNSASHRARALAQLLPALRTLAE